jgi:3-dehydroquinate dehydratase / shikimate dehydrogenase
MAGFGTGIRRICAVVAASKAAEMAALVRSALRETPTIELRLDWLSSDVERELFLRWLRKHRPRGATFLATCRRREGGGRFSGKIKAQLEWLKRAGEAGCAWVDLEVETVRKLPRGSIRGLGLPGILLSAHDFRTTPEAASSFRSFHLPRVSEVDGVKIAAHVFDLADSFAILGFARFPAKGFPPAGRTSVVVPMGDAGLPARILALRAGSALAYAPVADATAPGQVSLHDLKHLYRAHKLTRSTQVFGVIGNPVGHSLSPLMHNTGYVARKRDAVFLPFLVPDLREFLEFLKVVPDLPVRGFSVTLPHKQEILKYLKDCDALAADIGAVNTVVVRSDGSLSGSNTDYIGILRALEKRLKLAGSRVLIFGAGGAARAAAFALTRADATVVICARRDRAARELARAVGGETVPRRALRSESFDAIINATPIGMHPHDAISPLEPGELHCRTVMDLIYRPQRTQLLKLAARKGIATVSGVEMFLAQGIAQWEIFMKRRAPEAVMRAAVLKALRTEELQAETKHRGPR